MVARFIRAHCYMIISGILGAIAFVVLYGRLLDPSYIDWAIMIGGDPFQHYIGWEMFRSSPWSFPLGHISSLVYPTGISLTFTDSIPLFSFFFKLFSNLLPYPFQFEGIWLLTCFVLQGVCGYSLVHRFTGRPILSIIGSIFFILSPIMLFRLGGHSALGAHWLILWALILTLRTETSLRIVQWTILLWLTVLIHPYFLFMCGPLFVGDVVRRVWVLKQVSVRNGLFFVGATVTSTIIVSWIIGVFSAGSGSAPGYGVFSLDINGLINPYGYSTIIKNMNVREPNEGFMYLGFGVVLLSILSLYERVRELNMHTVKSWILQWWPILAVCTLLTVVAITNTVSVWGRVFIHIPLPLFLTEDVLGIVRSSGRLFWPVYYILLLGSLFVLKKTRMWVAVVIVVGCAVLQIYDMNDKLRESRAYFTEQEWVNPLKNSFWNEILEHVDHISFIPEYVPGMYEAIAFFAAQHELTLNTGYVVRAAGRSNEEFMRIEQENLKKGIVADRTLYIFRFMKEAEEFTRSIDSTKFQLDTIDGYVVLVPIEVQREE